MSYKFPLRYVDDADRAYGVAGMSIALVLWDGEPFLASVSLDNPVGDAIVFTPAFGYSRNPRLMASLAWREHFKQFELTSAMILSNAICRSYVRSAAALPGSATKALRDIIRSHGRDICDLEDDEADMVYNKISRYLDRVFTHTHVATIARSLAQALQQRRSMSASEVFEILEALNQI